MAKLLGSSVHLGRAAWSQIQSLFITTFNLKHNRDTALTTICYGKIKVTGLGFHSAFYDYIAICQDGKPCTCESHC
jgi:hypothetical protein